VGLEESVSHAPWMQIPSCSISPAINPTAENYKDKINRKIALLKREKQNVRRSKCKISAGTLLQLPVQCLFQLPIFSI